MTQMQSVFRGMLASAVTWAALSLPALSAAVPLSRPLPPAQPADDETPLLEPRQPRTERQQDRLYSMSLYAAARMADRAGSYSHAMALYARAYRYDPENIDSL